MEKVLEVQKEIKENAGEVNDFLKVWFVGYLPIKDQDPVQIRTDPVS